jgi:hypothetical protein
LKLDGKMDNIAAPPPCCKNDIRRLRVQQYRDAQMSEPDSISPNRLLVSAATGVLFGAIVYVVCAVWPFSLSSEVGTTSGVLAGVVLALATGVGTRHVRRIAPSRRILVVTFQPFPGFDAPQYVEFSDWPCKEAELVPLENLREKLRQEVADGGTCVIFDLKHETRMYSTLVGRFLSCKKHGATVLLVSVPQDTREVLGILRLSDSLPSFDSVAQAAEYYESEAVGPKLT